MRIEAALQKSRVSLKVVAPVAVLLIVAATEIRGQVMAVNGMVVTSSPMAAQAGLRILQQGGNAFDAAVATAATLAVVEPLMSGLGGVGGYALIYDSKKQQIRSLDFVGAAPAALKPEMFTAGARLWDRANPARDSFIAPLVPGSLAGWGALREQYGTMTWAQLLAPAIEYAETGVAVTPAVRGGFGDEGFGGAVGTLPVRRRHLLQGRRTVARCGRSETARSGEHVEVDRGGRTRGVLRRPARGAVRDVLPRERRAAHNEGLRGLQGEVGRTAAHHLPRLCRLQPAAGSSGMTVLQALNILEQFDVRALEHNSPEFVHLVAEAMKLAFIDEDSFNTGKSYAKIPLERLLSKDYAEEQAASIDLNRAQFYARATRPVTTSAFEHTTNHTVVDRDHNIVVITQTLMLPAGMAVPDTGVVFNNGMSYFSADPQDINFLEAGERPRFVMSPTIVTRHGQPYFALGSAGGWTIPQTILQVVLRALDFQMDAHDAVKAPRFVLQYLGNSIPYMTGTDSGLEKGFTDSRRAPH